MEGMVNSKGKVNPIFWNKKRVFITGHTGFKGSWLSLWLQDMGAVVKGYSLNPNTSPNLFNEATIFSDMESEIGDIRDFTKLNSSIKSFNPEILIHMAAQPLVRLSYSEPIDTYSTNVMGTLNVLESCRSCDNLKAIIAITTDKCYENKEQDIAYKESDPMGGHDPYSSSKGCCELLISSYRRSFFNNSDTPFLASVRSGNVIGGGDWSSDRLIPDILKAFENNDILKVRNPSSTRPWQHVLDPLSGYLVLAENLYLKGEEYAEAWNFGPEGEGCKPVDWILDKMCNYWGQGVKWELDKNNHPHEAGLLKLDCNKAFIKLNWSPNWSLEYTLKLIIKWHKNWLSGCNMKEECLNEIKNYINNN